MRQLDDPIMLVAQLHLAFGAHHAKALNTTDLANTNCGVNARNIYPWRRHDHCDAFARIWGAADYLRHTIRCLHLTDAQLIRIRVLFRLCHLANRKSRQLRCWVFNPFDFQTKVGQSIGDLIQARLGL